MRSWGLVVALALASCGRIGFDPLTGGTIVPGQCISQDKRDPSFLVDPMTTLKLCVGKSYLSTDSSAGDTIHLELAPAVPLNHVNLRILDPGVVEVGSTMWTPTQVEAAAFVRTTGASLIEIETDDATDAAVLSMQVIPTTADIRFLDEDGDDAATGEYETPWATWGHAIASLTPNSILIVRDGQWKEAVFADCTAGLAPQGPVHIVAQHPRQARIHSADGKNTFHLRGCADWTVDGLVLDGEDALPPTTGGSVLIADNSPRFHARDLILAHPNNCGNNPVFGTGAGTDDLVFEDSEVYDFHRVGVFVNDVQNALVQRVYVNSRDGADNSANGCSSSNYPTRGDTSFECYNFSEAPGCDFTDNISEDVGEGFFGGSEGTLVIRNFMVLDATIGILFNTLLPQGAAAIIQRMVCLDCDDGIYNRGFKVTVTSSSFYEATTRSSAAEGNGIETDNLHGPAGTIAITDTVALDNERFGMQITGMASWSIDHTISADNGTNFFPAEDFGDSVGNITNSSATRPSSLGNQDGNCLVYTPPESTGAAASSTGGPIGANIVQRGGVSFSGATVKLWNQRTGQFPCGAKYPGLNDIPGKSCFDVHERLRVGVAGCAIP